MIDPYILVSVEGPTIEPAIRFRTRTVKNNGFNPYWNEVMIPSYHNNIIIIYCKTLSDGQVFKFKVTDPDLCQLYLQVKDEDDINTHSFIAYSAVPIDCLCPGYRTFDLYDNMSNREGDFAFASLFCRVSLEPWNPSMEGHEDMADMGMLKKRSSMSWGSNGTTNHKRGSLLKR